MKAQTFLGCCVSLRSHARLRGKVCPLGESSVVRDAWGGGGWSGGVPGFQCYCRHQNQPTIRAIHASCVRGAAGRMD